MPNRDEQISALLDDALDVRELHEFMQDLKRDPLEDAARAKRYRLVGEAMRGEMNQASFMDISTAVHRAIDQEPMMADLAVVRKPGAFNFSAWLRPLSGIAIAASVAVVTVVLFRTVETGAIDNTASLAAQQATISQSVNVASITPINPAIAVNVRAASTLDSRAAQLRNQQLRQYIMNHSGYAGQTTMQGMIPYARAVGFDEPAKR
jgi:sigma-E factor negative regulatory protein RseA